jgi:hypothetical protein
VGFAEGGFDDFRVCDGLEVGLEVGVNVGIVEGLKGGSSEYLTVQFIRKACTSQNFEP